MQCNTPRTKRWERLNLVRNVVDKKKTRHANNQTSTLGLAHDFKQARCESKSKLKMMIIKEWSCNFSKMFF